MEYTSFRPEIIRDGGMKRQSERKVADGILHSAMLTSFQRHAIDGLINTGQMAHHGSDDAHSVKDILTHKIKASATHQQIGARHFPGSPAQKKSSPY